MGADLKRDIDIALRRLESFRERASKMLAIGKRGAELPRHLEFKEPELKALDDSLVSLVAQIFQSQDPDATGWLPPVRYAYKYGYLENEHKGKWSWLESFHDGLSESYHFLAVYSDSGKTCSDTTHTPVTHRVRILFLASNPTTTPSLDLEEELRSLESELRGVRYRDEISLIARHAVRPDDLVRHLRQEQPTIVHFSGHGSASGIVLRSENEHTFVSHGALQRLFRQRGVELVVLNACYSDTQAHALAQVVPSVVGTTDAVGDIAARRFSTAFYRTLGDGYSLGDAFRDGGDAVAVHELEDVFRSYGDLQRALVGSDAA